MTPEIEIHNIQFTADGIVVQFINPATDVRVGGAAFKMTAFHMSAKHPDYREDIEALHHKALRVLKNALEDYDDSSPYVPNDNEDDDEDRGMGE